MSVLIDAVGDYLTRGTSLPNFNSTYTIMAWVYRINDTNALSLAMGVTNNLTTQIDGIVTLVDGVTLSLYTNAGIVSGSVLNANEWHHLALVRESATSAKVYLDGVLDITNTNNVGTARTAEALLCGGTSGLPLGGRYAGFKQFTTAMTIDEVKQEMRTLRPTNMLSSTLIAWYPMWPGSGERVRDYSGAGLTWTEGGTITDADPPPVSYGGAFSIPVFDAAAGASSIPAMMYDYRRRRAS